MSVIAVEDNGASGSIIHPSQPFLMYDSTLKESIIFIITKHRETYLATKSAFKPLVEAFLHSSHCSALEPLDLSVFYLVATRQQLQ